MPFISKILSYRPSGEKVKIYIETPLNYIETILNYIAKSQDFHNIKATKLSIATA